MFFDFVRQRAAYEMRISGWRSDVCSADLSAVAGRIERPGATWLAGQRAKYSIAAVDHRERQPWCQFVKGVGELIGPMRVSCTHQWPQYPQSTGGDERYRSVTTGLNHSWARYSLLPSIPSFLCSPSVSSVS